MMNEKSRYSIVLIEDNTADVEAIRRGLNQLKKTIEIDVLPDGIAAKNCFAGDNQETNQVEVDLIFLDLNLPGLDGRQLLRFFNNENEAFEIPIVVLTTSRISEDIETTYRNGANGYIFKPNDWERLARYVQSACEFWFSQPD